MLIELATTAPFTFHSYKVNGPPFKVVAVKVLSEGEMQSVVEGVAMETDGITISSTAKTSVCPVKGTTLHPLLSILVIVIVVVPNYLIALR